MDPNANLSEQLFLVQRIQDCQDLGDDHAVCSRCTRHGARLAELVDALNGWLLGGGAFPDLWMKRREK